MNKLKLPLVGSLIVLIVFVFLLNEFRRYSSGLSIAKMSTIIAYSPSWIDDLDSDGRNKRVCVFETRELRWKGFDRMKKYGSLIVDLTGENVYDYIFSMREVLDFKSSGSDLSSQGYLPCYFIVLLSDDEKQLANWMVFRKEGDVLHSEEKYILVFPTGGFLNIRNITPLLSK